jgi:alcohol dehydrogenase
LRDVWRIDRAGSLDRLTRRSEPLPELEAGRVRVRVKAIGLNFADIFACLGLYSATPRGSFVPGLEFAGTVEAVHPGARGRFRTGDRVAGLTRFGAYATVIDADEAYLRPIHADWSFAEAAAFPAQALTAWYGLFELGAVTRGHVVLVQSAAGGVGLNALAMLDAVGARSIAVVGREAKRQWLIENRGLAVDMVVVRERRSFGASLDRALDAVSSPGFDVVFDAVAGPFLQPAFKRLEPGGRYVVYGAADFMPGGARPNYLRLALKYVSRPRIDPLSMTSANRSLMAFNLIWLWDRQGELDGAWNELNALVTTPPFVGRRFAFADALAAMHYLQSGESIGKVVLEV